MIPKKYLIFKNFTKINNTKKIKKKLIEIINDPNEIIKSLKADYKYSFSSKLISKIKKKKEPINLIGMGGSILGTKAIFSFLKKKIKKDVNFIDNLSQNKKTDNDYGLNIVVSKSGNTLETILNSNIHIKKDHQNVFITENKKSFLRNLALKLKAEIIDHNNFIGGRYSVLSEVGMLPASLVGLSIKKFKRFNDLIKNKSFIENLVTNVASIIYYVKKKKFNSVVLNYDEDSEDLFKWYQQLMAESLGKKGKGIFPIISSMPKDNHSLLQLYLDGPKNNFFTFFFSHERETIKIIKNKYFDFSDYLKNQTIGNILSSKKLATENVFLKKKIPYRSFYIHKKNEEVLGEIFTFFILEVILLGKVMNVNPYDQPSVELVKKETIRILKK
ncbi:glucose-6-phosphate isomerase [Candidatus Pelagibacter sp.]|jgi:glucose-6-phosphate isomerase|nr:glucose-6-phosphate isomerase [Candidatus Pelagibacter sp.]